MKQLIADITRAMKDEVARADAKYSNYSSLHEYRSVLQEEIEETEEEIKVIKFLNDQIWKATRKDDTETAMQATKKVYDSAILCAAEAVQVAAVCRRGLRLGGYENDEN